MTGRFRKLRDSFGLLSANTGWNCPVPTPQLSVEKRKQLLEATTLETPRSMMRSVAGILTPYWTKSSGTERAIAASLLATSLFMTWYAVQMTVEFGEWQGGLTNTVQQLSQFITGSRPDIIGDILGEYPALQQAMEADPLLKKAILGYPDMTKLLYSPEFSELVESNEALKEILQKNSSLEQLVSALPGMERVIAENPQLMSQVTALKESMSEGLMDLPKTQEYLGKLGKMSGGAFLDSWGNALSNTYDAASGIVRDGFDSVAQSVDNVKGSLVKAWNSRDLATIALKFTAMAIISYKAAQYLALRWRLWSTGYYTNRWMTSNAYARMKNTFNNIDNPGQRIEQDPAKFTAGAVSLMTGGASAAITLYAFSGQLWNMGPLMGVTGGFFWLGAAYAAGLTGITMKAGWSLPSIQRNQQRRDADLRAVLNKIDMNADLISQNKTEDVERDLVNRRLQPVMKNSIREIGTQVKLIVVDSTAGNLSIPIPWVVGAFGVAAGTASMGTVSMINYAFNRVTSAMSFGVNRFEQLSHMKATADRIYMFDRAMDAAHYIEEEKRQAAFRVIIPDVLPDMKISAPGAGL